MSGVALLFILLIGLMMASVPVGISLGLSTLVTMVLTTNLDVITIPQYCFRGLDSFPLMAIPFFMLAGNLMKFGGLSEKLINLSNSLVRGFKGGLGHVTVLASMFFAALSGSAPATVMAIGSNVIPQMEKHGYDRGYATALASTAGTIGVIIPPSIPLVIYGVCTGTSVGDLFIAGILPGILIGIGLIIGNYYTCKKSGYKGEEKAPPRTVLHTIWEAKWALLTPVIILGGIYSGIFTPTEAAIIAVVYSTIISVFVYKEMTLRDLYETFERTIVINGSTTFLLGISTAFAAYMSMAQIPAKLTTLLVGITDNKFLFLIIINVALLLIGCVFDNIPATIILSPMLLPTMLCFSVDPVHFGIILTVNLLIGLVTPPYGCSLFVASAVCGVSMETMLKRMAVPFLTLIISLLIITFVPQLSLCLL